MSGRLLHGIYFTFDIFSGSWHCFTSHIYRISSIKRSLAPIKFWNWEVQRLLEAGIIRGRCLFQS